MSLQKEAVEAPKMTTQAALVQEVNKTSHLIFPIITLF
jgi:hypothetical protein